MGARVVCLCKYYSGKCRSFEILFLLLKNSAQKIPDYENYLERNVNTWGIIFDKGKSYTWFELSILEKSQMKTFRTQLWKSVVGIWEIREWKLQMIIIILVAICFVVAITEHGLGQSVTVCIEPHSHRRLQTIPLMSVVPQDGKR